MKKAEASRLAGFLIWKCYCTIEERRDNGHQ